MMIFLNFFIVLALLLIPSISFSYVCSDSHHIGDYLVSSEDGSIWRITSEYRIYNTQYSTPSYPYGNGFSVTPDFYDWTPDVADFPVGTGPTWFCIGHIKDVDQITDMWEYGGWDLVSASCDPSIAETACGGADNVSAFDSELCTYECVSCNQLASECITQCDPFNVNQFDCSETTDGSGIITGLNITTPCGCFDGGCDKYEADCSAQCSGYYSFTCNEDNDGYVETYDCQCDDCSLERELWADANCHGLQYLDWYDCDSSTGACLDRTCNDALQDCTDQCGGLILSYSCDDSSGVASNIICECDNDLNQDNTPDNDPDTTVDGEQSSDPLDDDSSLLAKIVDNTKANSENVKAVHDVLDRELNELNKTGVETNNLIRQSNKLLEDIQSDLSSGFELSGSAEMPADNFYDIEFLQPEETPLVDSISGYITSGLPLQQFINNSGFTVANINPSLNCEIWGEVIDFDISPMEDTLNWMGLVIFAVSTVSAFMIVIKR